MTSKVLPALAVMISAYLAGAVAALALARRSGRLGCRIGHGAALLGAAAGVSAGACALAAAPGAVPARVEFPAVFPFVHLALEVDALSGLFLLIISAVAAAAALYAPAYLAAHRGHGAGCGPGGERDREGAGSWPGATVSAGERKDAVAAFLFNLFVLAMALVVCAADAFLFLLLWEIMTLASYFLVTFDTRDKASIQAGFIYVVMAHAGTAFILLSFLALHDYAGSFDLAAMRTAAAALPEDLRTWLFLALLVGFGTKAGLIPFHVWLPYAHPAAPSHVSALMSGVMLKTAVYGTLRFGIGILGTGPGGVPEAWGWLVLGLGVLSSVLGVLYALQEHDLKRLLAFHSVENMGIIFMGLGAALLFQTRDLGGLASIALAGALYHTANHAAFKGLLFLGAGSVQVQAKTLNIEDMGGLARLMPWTAGLFLLGAAAISALPPLNGFVSEWLTFQALLLAAGHTAGGLRLYTAGAAALLALTSGLAAACFVKAFGVAFLGRARSPEAEGAREAPRPMLTAMGLLGAACVVLGVAPGAWIPALDAPTAIVAAGHPASAALAARGSFVLALGAPDGPIPFAAAIGTGLIAFFLLALALSFAALTRRLRGATRFAETWTCGMTPDARFGYTAHAFSKAIRLIFAPIYRPSRRLIESFSVAPYFHSRIVYKGRVEDVFEHWIYRPTHAMILAVSARVRAVHTGSIHAYVAAVLLALLVALFLFARA